jgi:hypothetical protein
MFACICDGILAYLGFVKSKELHQCLPKKAQAQQNTSKGWCRDNVRVSKWVLTLKEDLHMITTYQKRLGYCPKRMRLLSCLLALKRVPAPALGCSRVAADFASADHRDLRTPSNPPPCFPCIGSIAHAPMPKCHPVLWNLNCPLLPSAHVKFAREHIPEPSK